MSTIRRVFKDSITLATSGSTQRVVKFTDVPIAVGDMLNRLRAVRFDVSISDADHAGDAVTPILWASVLSGVTLESDGSFIGPKNLDGPDLAAVRAFFTGERMPWLSPDATFASAGDANQTAGSNTKRRFVAEYRFDALSEGKLDFCPMIAALAKGNATLTFNVNAPSGVTNLVCTVEVTLDMEPSFDVVAVPVVVTERVSIDKLEGGALPGGLALGTLIKNAADWASGDITYFRAEADGKPILTDVEPDVLFLDNQDYVADLAAGVNRYATFLYPQGMNPTNHANRYKPFLCSWHSKDKRLTKKPIARSFGYTLTGSETAANLSFLHTRALPLKASDTARAWAASGKLDAKAIESAIESGAVKLKTPSKTLIQGDYAAFVPAKYNG